MDVNQARIYASLAASLIALSSTLYFWLVRANRERAQLMVQPIRELTGTVVTSFHDMATIQRLRPADDEYCIKYWMDVAIVNNSALPNALLGAKVWLQDKKGEWLEMDVSHQSHDQDLFPLNVPPLNISTLKMSLATNVRMQIDDSNLGRAAAAGDALPRQIPIQIELIGLQNKRFVREFLDSGNGLSRTPAGANLGGPRAAA